jgi:hypothetical protein
VQSSHGSAGIKVRAENDIRKSPGVSASD